MNILLIGGGAREHAMLKALARSEGYEREKTFAVMKNLNPGIAALCGDHKLVPETEVQKVVAYAKEKGVDLAFVGPEAPLQKGMTDALERGGINAAAPSKAAARIETSKAFMRELMAKHDIKGCAKFKTFRSLDGLEDFITELGNDIVVKPIGLTGGKGVKVMGEHLKSAADAVNYVKDILINGIGGEAGAVIEERLEGEEFTLQAFADGKDLIFMPCVQDHKRAFEGDQGPNTGGMGSYSQEDGLLPFVTPNDLEEAKAIMNSVLKAMAEEGSPYKGPIYGQFMLTAKGPMIIEINARFGDPEAMNVLPLLEGDMMRIGEAMVNGKLSEVKVDFKPKATVCKYVVPKGYGIESMADRPIEVDEGSINNMGAELFYASVNAKEGKVYTTTSRSLGIVGFGPSIEAAEKVAEHALDHVKGEDIFIRRDIGKREAIQRKIEHMNRIRG